MGMLWFNHSQSCKYSHTDKILFKLYSIRKSFDIPANASQLNSEDLKQKGPNEHMSSGSKMTILLDF